MVLKEHKEKRSSYWACFGRFLLVHVEDGGTERQSVE